MDKFYGCYLLESLSHKNITYIGFTVDPRRRLRQHNGEVKGGARESKSCRPWKMILCVWGLPNHMAAVQFEYAWQHPGESRLVRGSVRHLDFCKTSGKAFQRGMLSSHENILVLFQMLQTSPFCRMPLSVQILDPSTFCEVQVSPQLRGLQQNCPSHIHVSYGTFDDLERICAKEMTARRQTVTGASCAGCLKALQSQDRIVTCPGCAAPLHVSCAVQAFAGAGGALAMPDSEGECPRCHVLAAWPALVKSARKFSEAISATQDIPLVGSADGSVAVKVGEELGDVCADDQSNASCASSDNAENREHALPEGFTLEFLDDRPATQSESAGTAEVRVDALEETEPAYGIVEVFDGEQTVWRKHAETAVCGGKRALEEESAAQGTPPRLAFAGGSCELAATAVDSDDAFEGEGAEDCAVSVPDLTAFPNDAPPCFCAVDASDDSDDSIDDTVLASAMLPSHGRVSSAAVSADSIDDTVLASALLPSHGCVDSAAVSADSIDDTVLASALLPSHGRVACASACADSIDDAVLASALLPSHGHVASASAFADEDEDSADSFDDAILASLSLPSTSLLPFRDDSSFAAASFRQPMATHGNARGCSSAQSTSRPCESEGGGRCSPIRPAPRRLDGVDECAWTAAKRARLCFNDAGPNIFNIAADDLALVARPLMGLAQDIRSAKSVVVNGQR